MPKKLDRCVRKVRKKSPKVNPYAVCKASISKTKTIYLNWNNLESIKKAEKLKWRLENLGYVPVKDIQTGVDTWKIIYQKKVKK